jgi:hypothetical protein
MEDLSMCECISKAKCLTIYSIRRDYFKCLFKDLDYDTYFHVIERLSWINMYGRIYEYNKILEFFRVTYLIAKNTFELKPKTIDCPPPNYEFNSFKYTPGILDIIDNTSMVHSPIGEICDWWNSATFSEEELFENSWYNLFPFIGLTPYEFLAMLDSSRYVDDLSKVMDFNYCILVGLI